MTDRGSRIDAKAENPDLKTMHDDLVALVARLEASIDCAPTPAAIGAISDQIVEVNARVTATGRLLLAARTEEIARHARAVSAAIPDIERSIEDLERLERLVGGVAALLASVDDAVRAATLARR